MTHDKKNTSGTINFTLLKDIGDICINQTADKDTIFEMLDFYRECMGIYHILHQIYRIIKGNEIDFIPFLFPIPIDIIAYCEAIVRTIVLSYSFDIVKATFLYAF